jgi:hypothetical protein
MITKLTVNVSKTQFIKNIKVPVCNDCYYYVASKLKIGKCMKFGEKDIITGKINYENALHTRVTENMCSIKANYFEKK